MGYIRVMEFSVVIRSEALKKVRIEVEEVTKLLEFDRPLDMSEEVISYGPCFGGQAADEFCRRLEGIGLQYIDDFFVFAGDFPEWCSFKVGVVK